MGRRGPSPDNAKREAFAKLIAEGVPSARACRMVGIHPRTGKRWRNGRRIKSGGRVLNLPPVITVTHVHAKQYSPRCLSEHERVRLADLRHEQCTMREIVVLHGPIPVHDLPRARPWSRRRRPTSAVRGPPAGPGSTPSPSAQPPGPRRDAARLGHGHAQGALEPRAGLARPAPPVPRRAGTLAVRRDDLPGRLPSRPRRPAPGAPRAGPAPSSPPAARSSICGGRERITLGLVSHSQQGGLSPHSGREGVPATLPTLSLSTGPRASRTFTVTLPVTLDARLGHNYYPAEAAGGGAAAVRPARQTAMLSARAGYARRTSTGRTGKDEKSW